MKMGKRVENDGVELMNRVIFFEKGQVK